MHLCFIKNWCSGSHTSLFLLSSAASTAKAAAAADEAAAAFAEAAAAFAEAATAFAKASLFASEAARAAFAIASALLRAQSEMNFSMSSQFQRVLLAQLFLFNGHRDQHFDI